MNRVCAIIVTYRMQYEKIMPLMHALQIQVGKIYLVDNNEKEGKYANQDFNDNSLKCRIVRNGNNYGLAKALNQGIRAAIADGFNYFFLLDQDSLTTKNTVNTLLNSMISLEVSGEKVAAVGCSVFECNRKEYLPFLRFTKTGVKKINADTIANPFKVPVDFLITSGTLVSASAIKKTGFMDEILFVDNVDLEWCFRAKRLGFDLYGVPEAVILHRLGENIRRIPFSKRFVLIHAPIRQYYIMRNRLWLYRRSYVPFYWKVYDFPRLVFKVIFYLLMVKPVKEYAKMMFRGAVHGIFSRLGFRGKKDCFQ